MVWKSHLWRPVRMSYARAQPGGISRVSTWSVIDEPTMTVSRSTSGGDWDDSASRFCSPVGSPRLARGTPSIRSTRPPFPKSAAGRPVPASTAIRYPSPVAHTMRASSSFDQYATPRCRHGTTAGVPDSYAFGS